MADLATFLRDTIDAHFTRCTEQPAVAARGQNNPHGVWRVETADGPLAVKVYSQPPSERALAIERLAFEFEPSLLPEPLIWRNHSLVWRTMFDGTVCWVRASRWVDGVACAWGTVDATLTERVGGLLARVHALPIPDALPTEVELPLPTRDDWAIWADAARARNVKWAAYLDRQLPTLLAHAAFAQRFADSGAPRVVSQRDVHPPNVIERLDGAVMLVDWDAAGLALASAEVAQYAAVWSTPDVGVADPAVAAAFVGGYRAAGGVYHPRGAADFAPRSESLLQWIAFNARRDLAGDAGGDPELTLALIAGLDAPPSA
jgi:hypothetical protein